MKLPKFVLRFLKIDEEGPYLIPLPKLSTSLLRKLYDIILGAGFAYTGDKFRREKEYISILKDGALVTNFEPLWIMRELNYIKWEDYKENLGLKPSWNNSYFVKLKDGIRIYPRINLSKRGFYRLLAKGLVPLMYDEVYVILKLALESQRIRAISYRTYTAEKASFLRHVAKVTLYRVEFSPKSLWDCINEIWEDVMKGRPAFLPEPGTYTISMNLKEINLKDIFSGLDNWCLSDRNLAFPPGQNPSPNVPLDIS